MSVKKKVDVLKNFGYSTNCFLKNGKLIPGYTCRETLGTTQLDNASFLYYSRLNRIYFACIEDMVYVSTNAATFNYYCDYDNYSAFVVEDYVNNKPKTIFISGNLAITYYNGAFSELTLKENMTCGALHCGRLFGGSVYKVKWSGPNGFDDWEEGINGCGQVTLDTARGSIVKMFEFCGKLLVVQQYGFTFLSAYGSPENFSVDITDTGCDLIYTGTIQLIKDKVYFYSETGLKYFDGKKIVPFKVRHGDIYPWASAVFKGKYFIAGTSNVLGRNVILCIDLEDGESCIIDETAKSIYTRDKVYFFNDILQKRIDDGGSYVFESSELDFGTDKKKTVTEIRVKGKAEIGISNGRYTRKFNVENQTIRPRMRGKRFKITVSSESIVEEVTATAEVMDAV